MFLTYVLAAAVVAVVANGLIVGKFGFCPPPPVPSHSSLVSALGKENGDLEKWNGK